MPANKKLTKVIVGRTIQSAVPADRSLTLTLDDGSTLAIKTAPGNPNTVPTGGKLLKAREDGSELDLDFADGSTVKLTLADPGNSLAMRDKNHKVEYMG